MTDDRQRILDRVDLVGLVSQRVSLRRTGKTYKGLCPFHDDKNPSFTVNAELGRYRCWSCGEHGDAFTWVMKTQNVEFVEALKLLAEQAGIELIGGSRGPKKEEKAASIDAMATANEFFRAQLKASPEAKAYAQSRQMSPEEIEAWEIGYAPQEGAALANLLSRKGISLAEAKELFLVNKDQGGSYYDIFRGRLMFPIRDEKGELVAFGGRILGKGDPKYINSSDTKLYRKSRVLYGFDRARPSLQKSRQAILVEGYLDVIACHAAGLKTAVASCGTALAEDQCKLLSRWADEVVILYDGDAAGVKATRKAIALLQAESLRVRVALLSAEDDPDSLLRSEGPSALMSLVKAAVTPIEFEFQKLLSEGDPDQPAFWEQGVALLAQCPNAMDLEKYLQRLAPVYPGLKDVMAARRALRQEVMRARHVLPKRAPDRAVVRVEPKLKLAPAEVAVMSAALHETLRPRVWQSLSQKEWFITQEMADAASDMATAFPQPPTGPAREWIGELSAVTQEMLERVSEDPRRSRINETILQDALDYLKRKFTERSLQDIRSGVSTDSDRQAYLDALKPLKNRQG